MSSSQWAWVTPSFSVCCVVGSPHGLSPWFGSTALSSTCLGNFPMYLATPSPWLRLHFHTFMPSPLMSSIKAIQLWHGLSNLGCLLEPCHEPPFTLVSCMIANQQHVDNTRSCCQLGLLDHSCSGLCVLTPGFLRHQFLDQNPEGNIFSGSLMNL